MIATLVTALLFAAEPPPAPEYMGFRVGMTRVEVLHRFGVEVRPHPERKPYPIEAVFTQYVYDRELDAVANLAFRFDDGVLTNLTVTFCDSKFAYLCVARVSAKMEARLRASAGPTVAPDYDHLDEGVRSWDLPGDVWVSLLWKGTRGVVVLEETWQPKK